MSVIEGDLVCVTGNVDRERFRLIDSEKLAGSGKKQAAISSGESDDAGSDEDSVFEGDQPREV